MNYSNRLKIALSISVLVHAAGISLLQRSYAPPEYSPTARPEPIILDLQPEQKEQPKPPRQLVDVTVPADTPPPPSDRIAEQQSESMDLALRQDTSTGPALKLDDFDALPSTPAPPVPPEPTSPPPSPEPKKKTEDRPEKAVDKKRRRDDVVPRADAVPEPDTSPQAAPEQSEALIQIAQAQPTPPQQPEPGMARERGGVSKQGQTNFDAIQSEIAPYLKNVRQRVERQWNEMLYTRYSGTSPVKTVIDCAINPQGELVSVTVVGTDNDRLYSALCRDAVQRAGPFGPFPFEVPDIYRGKNLEIRWTFSFL